MVKAPWEVFSYLSPECMNVTYFNETYQNYSIPGPRDKNDIFKVIWFQDQGRRQHFFRECNVPSDVLHQSTVRRLALYSSHGHAPALISPSVYAHGSSPGPKFTDDLSTIL